MNVKTEFKNCVAGNHQLKEILDSPSTAYGNFTSKAVVRWCQICGSIVVDREYQNKTRPGDIMIMKSPAIAKRIKL